MSFETIARVEGAGNSTSVIDYKQLDTAPLKGMNYYRLKQVDYNGDFTYSNVISISNDGGNGNDIALYPNPTSDVIHINTPGNEVVTIYDMLGKVVYSGVSEGSNTIDFVPLTSGVYVVKAVDVKGNMVQRRFIKN